VFVFSIQKNAKSDFYIIHVEYNKLSFIMACKGAESYAREYGRNTSYMENTAVVLNA
jgi:hypothetical protein